MAASAGTKQTTMRRPGALPARVARLARGARFSLLELMMVTVVTLILLGLSAPAIRSIMRASAVDAGASAVAMSLRVARQYAIAQNVYVAVLMPTAQTANQGGADDNKYRASSFRLCVLARAPTLDNVTRSWDGSFDRYVPETNWEYLPGGVYIGYTDTHGEYGSSAATCRCNTVSQVLFPENTSATTVDRMRAVIFRPDGSVVPSPQGASPGTLNTRLVVYKGVLDLANGRVLPEGEGLQQHELLLIRFTGKVDFLK